MAKKKTSKKTGTKKTAKKAAKLFDGRLYELRVTMIRGIVTEAFAKENPKVERTIEIRGDQTLMDLHFAIFDAFERYDEHMYEFQIGGKKPHDRNAKAYMLPMAIESPFAEREAKYDLTVTKLDDLELRARQVFFYWFDYGDDWWHKIAVKRIHKQTPPGKYPRVTDRLGESPPQYFDWDGDEDWDDEEDGEEEEGGDEE